MRQFGPFPYNAAWDDIITCIVITCIVAMLWLLTNSMQDRGSDMLG